MTENVARILVITGDSWRHRFLVNRLAGHFTVAGVVCEQKKPFFKGTTTKEGDVFGRIFAERDEKEKEFFGVEASFHVSPQDVLSISQGGANAPLVYAWARERAPRYIVLFGSSIIKEPLLGLCENRTINLHLGLSPYYRGAATNFWPLVHGKPECVGVTVHLAVQKVDAGPVLAQVRPDVAETDGVHDFGFKAVIAGVRMLAEAVKKYEQGDVVPKPQIGEGVLCRRADLTIEAIDQLERNFASGMVAEYLSHKKERDAVFPIVGL